MILLNLVWAVAVWFYAAWWDRNTRTVPNWLWLLYLPVSFILGWERFWPLEVLLLPMLFMYAWVMFKRGAWGAADAKALICLGLGVGALHAALCAVVGSVLAWTFRDRWMKVGVGGSVPFMIPFALGVWINLIILLVLGFLWNA